MYDEIDKLRSDIAELNLQVQTDHLTSLFNARHFHYSLEQEMERTRRSHQPTTLIMLDIDHFKSVNDTYGHLTGDKILVHLSALLLGSIRKLDIPCRYGGEEFAIILPSTPVLVASQVAERIRKKIEQTPLTCEGKAIAITASFGVGTFLNSINEDTEAFIQRVDKQLYHSKHLGRNRISYSSDISDRKTRISAAEKDALFDQDNPRNSNR